MWGVTGVEEITLRLVTHTQIGEVHSRTGSIVSDTGNVPLRLYSMVESVELGRLTALRVSCNTVVFLRFLY
jgi:hypothetical protein